MGSEKHNRAKCLDDCCHIGSREDSRKFYNTYKEVSEECGVRLAPSDDPDKCFGPSTAGTILGSSIMLKNGGGFLFKGNGQILI